MAEFDEKLLEIIRNKEGAIFRGESFFTDRLEGIEKRLFKATREQLGKLNKTGGKFDFDEENIALIAKLDSIIIEELQRSDYPGSVRKYLQDFDLVTDYNAELHESLNDIDPEELKNLVDPFKQQTVEDTLQGLTGSGVSTQFVEPVRQELFKNIVAGENATDIEATLRRMIEGDADTLGGLSRYVGQVTRDALNQYDGQINAKIADEFGLDAYQYVGSLIDDSRPQCVRWVGKNVLLKEELEQEINWANSNGSGMIPGTTPQNFAIFRGGYNCRHSAIPFKMTKAEKERLEKERAETEEEEFEETDLKIEQLEKKPKKKPSKSTKQFDENVLHTTLGDPIIQEGEQVFANANNLIEFANAKGMNVNFRTAAQSTTKGSRKFAEEINAKKPNANLNSINVGQMRRQSNGNCAVTNTFLNIKVKKGDVCDFVPVDLDTSPKAVERYKEKFNLEFVKHRGTSYLITPDGKPFLQETTVDGEKVWRFWSVGAKAEFDLPKKGARNIATTITHESAHAIQFNYDGYGRNAPKLKALTNKYGLALRDSPTIYGMTDFEEFFAESFAAYVYDNKGLKKRNQKVFNFVEEYLQEIGVDLKTVKVAK